MAGGKSTPKKDKSLKVGAGQAVKTGQIILRGLNSYKAGRNVTGRGTLSALCDGKISFTKKRISHGPVKTYINVNP
jgi:ribosomal protein L27